ncbi:hypothetical protein NQ317_000712 [Molorchus minor]|uniref:Uncharacterized protein n=1 Tax=Molorchus minor TaxID=1323400 RepID=A0ABQ9J0W2_9CUCU|nr:hypothetical protein NQ317_000712 [Molorchus minor]
MVERERGGEACASKSEGSEAAPLDLQNVVAFIEVVLHIRKRAKKHKLSFKEEFKREFKRNVKEVPPKKLENINENQFICSDTYGFKKELFSNDSIMAAEYTYGD